MSTNPTSSLAALGAFLAECAETVIGPNVILAPMTASGHDDIVRQSFRRQVSLFAGPDSPFARRDGAMGWLEPLSPEMIVLEAACGAAHVSDSVASSAPHSVGVRPTP